ncbi:hypothetical protein [Nocardia sp. NPDC020380]|uniref:hypothetical protein n=1 Tax=Nocardia sp. NPDC020380 TaxID=3364309 RepID=UPI0037A69C18
MVAALGVAGVYGAALVRLAVSKDWRDLTATHLLGLASILAGLLALLTVGLVTIAGETPRRRWTKRRVVAAVVVCGLLLAGFVRSLVSVGALWGDAMGQLLVQTASIAGLLFFIIGWIPLEFRRR